MVCHYSCLPNYSSVPSSNVCTSLGNRRPCTKLWATRPPTPFSHTRTLVVEGRGLPSNMNEGCHAWTAQEVDATFSPVWATGSRMTMPPDGRGGVLVGASPESAGVFSIVRGLFRVQLVGRWGGEFDLGIKVVATAQSAGCRAQNGW